MGVADERMVARLQVISEVSAAALGHPSRGGVYQAVADSIVRHLSYFEANVFEVREAEGELALVAHAPAGEGPQAPPYRQPLADGLLGVAARERRSVLVNDVSRDARYLPPPAPRACCASELCTPVLAGDRVAAVIDVECREPDAFGESDRVALEAIANMVGLALRAAEAHEALEQQVEQVRQAQCQLVHSERLADVGRLTARVAHEIRNPLSTIGGFARRIQRHDGLDDTTARYTAVIIEEVERLERLLSGIMDFVRPGPPRKQPTDVNAVLRRSLLVSEAARAGKQIIVTEKLAPGLPPVQADPGQLEQVFINLISNAFDSIAGEGSVVVSSRCAGDQVVVGISDTGGGIMPDELARIFDPFYTTKQGGTGLGLTVASKIIEDHGGRILIGSEPGKGTHARVRLPAAPSSPA